MKKFFAGAMLLASFAVALPTFAQKPVHPNVVCSDCDDPGDPPGPYEPPPGGGGGGFNPAINWVYQSQDYVYMGGTQDRRGPGAALFNRRIYVAYTAQGGGDQPVYMANFGDNGGTQYVRTNIQGSQNPVLEGTDNGLYAVVNTSQGNMQLLFNPNPSGAPNGFSQVWTLPGINDYTGGIAHDGSNVYIGLRDHYDHKLTVCRFNGSYTTSTCTHFPNSSSLVFNPGMIMWNGTLYIAYEDDDGAHTVRYYTSTDGGQNITPQGGASGDQSSTEPRLAVRKNVLYMIFRANDGSHNLLYKYSQDGYNWSPSMQTGYTGESVPTMVSTETNYFQNYQLYTYYGSNDSNHSVVLMIGYGN